MSSHFAERYAIQRELGRGSFGVVYLATDTRLRERPVALKVLHPQLTVDAGSLQIFEAEAGVLATLRHDHIVTVYDAGIWQEQRYLVMEYIAGPALAQVVQSQGAQPPDRTAGWLAQAADALAHAHAAGVIHRDIKAANLILEERRGRIFITDFGLARAAEVSGGSSAGGSREALTGTAAYRAPEVRKTGHTVASDLYSLGVVGYELLAGRRPFTDNDPLDLMLAHATDPVPPLPAGVPASLGAVVLALLAKEPAARPASAAALHDLLTARHAPSPSHPPTPSPTPQPRWQQIGIELIRIPAGEFLYGDDKRRIHLNEFWISKTPVTVDQFRRFVEATGYKSTAEEKGSAWVYNGSSWTDIQGANWQHPKGPGSDVKQKGDHPVTCVSWFDAVAFCNWCDLYLPTEEQWEKAARGTDGRTYPWGEQKPDVTRCNFDQYRNDTTPVGKYPTGASPYGLLDMAGNVWEWCQDWYDDNRNGRVIRGGSWYNSVGDVRCASRNWFGPDNRFVNYGFRVVSPGS